MAPLLMLFDTRSFDSGLTVTDAPEAAPPAWAGDIAVTPGADLWVFAYGSLMWNPGFPFEEQHAVVLHGYHRRFCVSSHRYRGTPERPGLVLGLDRGGSCRGVAFRVAAGNVPATLDYLWDREMITRVYRPRRLPVHVLGGGPVVEACTFVVDRRHRQYCGCLDETHMAERIAGCCGERGPNVEYLANTVAQLERMGIHDAALTRLLTAVRRLTA